MALAFRCSQCGKTYSKSNDWAGKVINCEGCGKAMRIPSPPAGLLTPEPQAAGRGAISASARATGPVMGSARSPSPMRPGGGTAGAASAGAAQATKPSLLKTVGSTVLGVVVVFGMIGRFVIRPYRAWQKAQAAQKQQAQIPNAAVPRLVPAGAPSPALQPFRGPWRMPELPQLGDEIVLQPGIEFYEVHLPGGGGGNSPKMPGHSGKLWLYLPEGDHAPGSLPCIVIAGAGSKLITGMTLGDGDRPEHLPYVREGFAVLAYELDGMLPDPEPTDDAHFAPFVRSFLDAEAGLINMRVALEFATTRVPAIDPKRLYAAGHSSAATLALLVAENEPRIAACVAYAPVVDLAEAFPKQSHQAIAAIVPGADQFFNRFNPRTGESNIRCPLFLFVADDDRNTQQVRDFATRLEQMGKTVTLLTVPRGGHYNPMIQTGIPRAIGWLKSLQQGANRAPAVPKANPAPRLKTNPRRMPRGPNMPRTPGGRRPGTGRPPGQQTPDQ